MTATMCAEHQMPTRECEGVELTRRRRAPVCLCAHPKTVHQHHRPGLDCGLCDCLHYEAARGRDLKGRLAVLAITGVIAANALLIVGGVAFGVVWPLVRAVAGR